MRRVRLTAFLLRRNYIHTGSWKCALLRKLMHIFIIYKGSRVIETITLSMDESFVTNCCYSIVLWECKWLARHYPIRCLAADALFTTQGQVSAYITRFEILVLFLCELPLRFCWLRADAGQLKEVQVDSKFRYIV